MKKRSSAVHPSFSLKGIMRCRPLLLNKVFAALFILIAIPVSNLIADVPGVTEGCPCPIDCLGVCCGTAQIDACGVCGGLGPAECGCDKRVVNLGCGCGKPAPGPCGCDRSIVDLGCGCDLPGPGPCGCDWNIRDQGCGCGKPAPGPCGCDPKIKDLGCGCGKPAPGPCGCDPKVKDLGCGCGKPAPGPCGCDPKVKDLGCGCGKPTPGPCGCDPKVKDLGCGCGKPAPGPCGCDPKIKDLGCGCGKPAPGPCGCDLKVKDLGCGCGKPGPDPACGLCKCPKCSLYEITSDKLTQNWADMNEEFYEGIGEGKAIFTGAGAKLTCLEKFLDKAYQNCKAGSTYDNGYRFKCDKQNLPGRRRTGDALDDEVGQLFFNVDLHKIKMASQYAVECMKGYKACKKAVPEKYAEGIFTRKYRYIDSNCNFTNDPPNGPICGELQVNFIVSPVSLLWDPQTDVRDYLSYVQFPLQPGDSQGWYSWHASAATPLVVYDPARSGKISSADQLFGNWSFGGNNSAGLMPVAAGISRRQMQPWPDGFAALASLDANSDGRLSGVELNDLALWFDNNQDGLSQAGEVRSLEEEGVTALFFQAERRDPVTKDLFAPIGYERLVNGKIVRGGAVDWFAERFSTQFEAINAELQRSAVFSKPAGKAGAEKSFASSGTKDGTADPAIAAKFEGIWLWTLTRKGGKPAETVSDLSPKGMLRFAATDNGGVAGYSVVEAPISVDRPELLGQATAVMSMFPAHGAAGTVDGSAVLRFLVSGDSNADTWSEARLSEDGDVLYGKSETEVRSTSTGGKPVKLTYTWQAWRAVE